MDTKEIPEEIPEEEVKADETVKVTRNKNGKPRKTLNEEDQKKRLEILAKGRAAAAEKRRKLREEAKAAIRSARSLLICLQDISLSCQSKLKLIV